VSSKTSEQAFQLKEKMGKIDALISNKAGLRQAVGPTWLARGATSEMTGGGWGPLGAIYYAINPAQRQEFSAGVQQLTSKETMDGLLALKAQGGTLGALNESEGRMLREAASKIGGWTVMKDGVPTGKFGTSEENFLKELEHLRSLAGRAYAKALGSEAYSKESGFDYASAKAAGYSDEEIMNELLK
jgi:hypothetical protein